jgi:hypothetical protein
VTLYTQQPEDLNFDFTPVPSLSRIFEATPQHKMIFIMGPVGSTKTTTALHWLLLRAMTQEPSPDGIRRTRFGIIRNTLVQLRQTVLKDILSLFQGLAEYRSSENTIWLRVPGVMESEWILLGLDKPEDLRRLLSLQLTGVYINETREIDYPVLFAAFSRSGRFPSPKHGKVKCTYRFLVTDSNMGVDGSLLHEFLERKSHRAIMYVKQPGALSPEADWLQYLPAGYYDDLMIGATRAWIDTHVHAKWSADLSGEPVFAAIFNEHFHVATQPLQVLPNIPIVAGIDPGVNPACVLGQVSARGQVRIYREIFALNTLMGMFVDSFILPTMAQIPFAGKPFFFTMDPAGINRHAVSGVSSMGVFQAKGLDVTLASTNDIDPRLKIIETYLSETRGLETDTVYRSLAELKQSGPAPALIIDPSCTTLIEALRGKYRYKRKKVTLELEDVPEKKHPTSDVVDSLGYLLLSHSGSNRFRRKASRAGADRIKVRPQISPLAWT